MGGFGWFHEKENKKKHTHFKFSSYNLSVLKTVTWFKTLWKLLLINNGKLRAESLLHYESVCVINVTRAVLLGFKNNFYLHFEFFLLKKTVRAKDFKFHKLLVFTTDYIII